MTHPLVVAIEDRLKDLDRLDGRGALQLGVAHGLLLSAGTGRATCPPGSRTDSPAWRRGYSSAVHELVEPGCLGAPLVFAVASPADGPAVVALVESAYRGETSRAGWTTEADLLDGQRTDAAAVAEAIADPRTVVLLAQRAAELLACCQLTDEGAGSAYFGMFAVRPERQSSGVGRQLLAHAEARAVERFGARRIRMTVIAQRAELVAWYERRGYRRTGERLPFPYGDERFGIPRRADLEFVVLDKAVGVGAAP